MPCETGQTQRTRLAATCQCPKEQILSKGWHKHTHLKGFQPNKVELTQAVVNFWFVVGLNLLMKIGELNSESQPRGSHILVHSTD